MSKRMKKLKVVGYSRVSTLEQSREGVSLDNQEHKISAYAELKDMELVEMIVEEGKSGKTLNRPGLQKLINLINTKQVDAVICYKLDRLTRKTRDLLYLIEDVFTKNNIQFISLNENIDTSSASGKFFLTVMGAMAQMERDLIAERTIDALQELTRQGRRLGSPDRIPLGFKLNKRKMAKKTDLVIDKNAFDKVISIFSLRRQKLSLQAIGDKFGMGKSSIKYILDNQFYRDYLPQNVQYTDIN